MFSVYILSDVNSEYIHRIYLFSFTFLICNSWIKKVEMSSLCPVRQLVAVAWKSGSSQSIPCHCIVASRLSMFQRWPVGRYVSGWTKRLWVTARCWPLLHGQVFVWAVATILTCPPACRTSPALTGMVLWNLCIAIPIRFVDQRILYVHMLIPGSAFRNCLSQCVGAWRGLVESAGWWLRGWFCFNDSSIQYMYIYLWAVLLKTALSNLSICVSMSCSAKDSSIQSIYMCIYELFC